MGRRDVDNDAPYKNFWSYTGKSGAGRYWKRRLSKLRRAAAKRLLMGRRPRHSVYGAESECNWKGH